MKKIFLSLLVLLTCLPLAACVRGAVPVQPVKGLPQGTDGFAWWNDTVFYEIFVRSYYDSNGDGKGDLNGIIQKLDYLNDGDSKTNTDLGVSGIWLMPIHPSPSYHGYDVTDYYAVNPDYGSLDDLKRLLDECHKRGIRVIIDMVLNHTSSDHPWFTEARDNFQSTHRDWYIWSGADPGYLGPWNEQVWYPSISGFYYAIFWVKMPDLNYTNTDVTNEINNVARYWLKDVGLDGFRLDAARYLVEEGKNQADTASTHAWWAGFRTVYKDAKPDSMTVGEVWTTNYSVVNYVKGDELDMAFNFDLASQIMSNVSNRNAANLGPIIQSSYNLFKAGTYATFLTNHDQERVMSFFEKNQDLARLAATVLLTIPGTPYIYYGEEIGMTGNKPDEKIRTPMQWSAEKNAGFSTVYPWENVNADYKDTNVAAESTDPNSLLSLYRTLISLRNQHAALRIGDYHTVRSDNTSILSYSRVSKDEKLLVLVNMSKKDVNGYKITLSQGTLSNTYHVFPVVGEGTPPDLHSNAGGGFDAYQPGMTIPANGYIVLQLR